MGIVVPWTEFVVRTYMYTTYNIQDMSCAERAIRQAWQFASRACRNLIGVVVCRVGDEEVAEGEG